MVLFGSIASIFTTAFGMAATAIAVCGFLAHAGPALRGESDRRLREATVRGGLAGFLLAVFIGVLSAIIE
jgi:hypothetical protein